MFFNLKDKRNRLIALAALAAGLLIAEPGNRYLQGIPAARAQSAGSKTVQSSSGPGQVVEIDVHTLRNLMQMDPNLCLVDVRPSAELSGPLGQIPRAVHISLVKIITNPTQFSRDKTLVFISRSGRRSLAAARAVAASGRLAYSVKGGLEAWYKSGGAATVTKPPRVPKKPVKKAPSPKQDGDGSGPGEEEDMGC